MVNAALPESLRREGHNLDKAGIKNLLREVAEQYPDQYKDVVQKLMMLGQYAIESTGSSLSLRATLPTPEVEQVIKTLRKNVDDVAESNDSDDEKERRIVQMVGKLTPEIRSMIFEAGKSSGNPLAIQAASGSRGNAAQLQQIVAGDMLVQDHRDRVIGIPILHGYSEGLSPVEYFAASYGARKGTVDTKFSTAKAGFLSKQLNQAAHRLVVTEKDCGTSAGMRVPAKDADNVGALLASDTDGLTRDTILDARAIKGLGDKEITIRSPITCQSREGVCAKCAGVREKGRLPDIGDNIGLPAAQALSEKVSQMSLSSKHSGGAVGGGGVSKGGFANINNLVQVPTAFHDAATLSETDGLVHRVVPAPQGGFNVTVGEEEHFVPPGQTVVVKVGQTLEAGDSLSDGIPNPADVVRHKGLGEGRRYFTQAMYDAFKASGTTPHRRNVETLARAMVNHVRITDNEGYNGFLPDDIVTYDQLRANYQPREGMRRLSASRAVNQYLESPALHYTPGTRVTPRMVKSLASAGITEVDAHPDKPPFEPVMIRAMESAMRDPDWRVRMAGSYLQKGFTEAVHRGRTSEESSTSFIPALVSGPTFGKDLNTFGRY